MTGPVEEDVLQIIDVAASAPVVIFGTPPPYGRDLDLLTARVDAERIGAALRQAGFEPAGRSWARFRPGRAELVEVVPASHWRVADAQLEAVAAAGQPLAGCTRIVVPAPADRLVFLARRFARDGRLDPRRRSQLDTLGSPAVWQQAARRADPWGVSSALAAMHAAYELPPARPRPQLAPLAELLAHQGLRWPHARAAAALARSRRRPRGTLIAFSGLDGAGKSSRVAALQATLEALGYDVAPTWNRLGSATRLDAAAVPVKRLAKRLVRRPLTTAAPRRYAEGHVPDADPGRTLRERSQALTYAWALFVTVVQVAGQRRSARQVLRAGRVVLADRWLLDSLVHLHYRYGERPFRLQRFLLRHAVPTASVAFLVEVPPAEALRRKSEQYDLGNLGRQWRLYRELAPALQVRVVDGMRSADALDAEIALAVWRAIR